MQIRELLVESSNLLSLLGKTPDAKNVIVYLHQHSKIPFDIPFEELTNLDRDFNINVLIQAEKGWVAIKASDLPTVTIFISSNGETYLTNMYRDTVMNNIIHTLGTIKKIWGIAYDHSDWINRKRKFQRKHNISGMAATQAADITSPDGPDGFNDPAKKIPNELGLAERLWKPYSKQIFGEVRRRIRKIENSGNYHLIQPYLNLSEFFTNLLHVAGDRTGSWKSEASNSISSAYAAYQRKELGNSRYTPIGEQGDDVWELWLHMVKNAATTLEIEYQPGDPLTSLDLQNLLPEIVKEITQFLIKIFFRENV